VERLASAVKERLENALDAGAIRIDIHVEDDGTRLIRVADNGCGISRCPRGGLRLRHHC
jgi:DNA mismatch repair protein MutL